MSAAVYEPRLADELAAQARSTPLPPWRRYDFERYSIEWRMGPGESYANLWWFWAQQRSLEALVTYFREFLPLPMAWVDWVGMNLDDATARAGDTDDSDTDDSGTDEFDTLLVRHAELAAAHGLVDLAAWRAAVGATS
jgi:hypothetical protein